MEPNERLNMMLVDANPVPDVNQIDLVDKGAAAYLELVQRRSSELAQLDIKEESSQESKRSVMPWLVAAVLIAVVGLAAIFLAQDGDETPVATEPLPSTVPEAAPPTVADVAPTTLAAVEDEWDQMPTLAFAGAEGVYRTDGFGVPFSVTLPDGWIRGDDEFDQVELSPTLRYCGFDPGQTEEQDALCRGVVNVGIVEGPTIDEIVQAFSETDGISPIEVTETEIGGMAGVWIEPSVTGDQPLVVRVDEETDFLLFPGDLLRLYMLEVAGSTVRIDVGDFEDGAFFTESQPIIESLIWRDAE